MKALLALLFATTLSTQAMSQAVSPKPPPHVPAETMQPMTPDELKREKHDDRLKEHEERMKDVEKENCNRELAACTNLSTVHCKEIHDRCAHVTK